LDPVYLLRAAVRALLLPPGGPLLVAVLGLILLNRRPKLGRVLAWGGVLALLLLSLPAVAYLLLRSAGDPPALDLEQARSAQAVVILGGGLRYNAAEFGGDTLGRYTLERVRYGARVARATGLPVLVSGGSLAGGKTEAGLMREALEHEFGVPVKWAEARSRDTHENARESAVILRAAGVTRVVLVTHAPHMPRSRAEFERAGLEVVPAPTHVIGPSGHRVLDYLPSVFALQASHYACYELLGNVVRIIADSLRRGSG
jgi:uncharacterized SAM-binding protein YcdF (DUF218 family)